MCEIVAQVKTCMILPICLSVCEDVYVLRTLISLLQTMTGPEREYVVAYDAGGKEPVLKLVAASKNGLLEKAKFAFGVSGSYEMDYMHPKLGLYIRPDNAGDIPDDCTQVRLVSIVGQMTPSSPSTASTVPILTIQETTTAADVERFLNPSVGPSTP